MEMDLADRGSKPGQERARVSDGFSEGNGKVEVPVTGYGLIF